MYPDQKSIFEGLDELVVIAGDKKIEIIEVLEKTRLSCLIASDMLLEDLQYFSRVYSKNNTYIIGYNGAKELLKRENYYYISGLVAVLYPDNDKEALEMFRMTQKYLSHKHGIHLIHILSENIYIPGHNKSLTDYIEGRVIAANNLID